MSDGYVPAPHEAHPDDPIDATVPTPHDKQPDLPALAAYEATGHSLHDALCWESVYDPAAHKLQEVASASL